MTKIEFGIIAGKLTAIYNIEFDDARIDTWHKLLSDLDFRTVSVAVKKIGETVIDGYRINPALIRKYYSELNIDLQSVEEATSFVMRLASSCGRNGWQQAYVELEKENPLAYKIVRSIGWTNICNGEHSMVSSQFERAYKSAFEDYKSNNQLSSRTQKLISSVSKNIEKSSFMLLSDNYD